MKSKIKVEFQHFHGCPNGPKLLNNYKEAIIGYEEIIDFIEKIIDTPELAKVNNFRGSPTLLIEGIDLEDMSVPENPSLSCRFYKNGLPTSEFIRNHIMTKVI